MLAFDEEYGIPDNYFAVCQLARATLSPWSKDPIEAEAFVPYFAPPRARRKQTTADHKAAFARFARKSPRV